MNFRQPFIANAQTAKLVQPGDRTFDNPAIDSQATAVFRSSFGQYRFDAAARAVDDGAVQNHSLGHLELGLACDAVFSVYPAPAESHQPRV